MFQLDNSNSEPSVQYVPKHYTLGENLGFDDSGECVPVCQPEVYRKEQEQDTSRDPEQWLALILAGAWSRDEIGERYLLVAYLGREWIYGAPQSLRELAARLGCSHATARAKLSKLSAAFVKEYAKFRVQTIHSPHL